MVHDSLEIGKSDEGLVASNKRKRRLRIWLIGLAIGALLLAGLITLIVLLARSSDDPDTGEQIGDTTTETTPAPPDTMPPDTTLPDLTTPIPEPIVEHISMEDVISGRLTPTRFNGVWTTDTEYVYKSDDDRLISIDAETGESTELISAAASPILSQMFDFELSPDRSHLMVAWDYQKLYRHSYTARYTCIDLTTLTETEIIPPNVPEGNDLHLQLFVWGPNDNSLAFVYANNIYYKRSVSSEVITITTDGSSTAESTVYNGIPDWVYEEEVFSSHKALWFSPDGNLLAYGRFDDTNVQVMSIPYYGRPGAVEYQYTRHLQVRYPKAGSSNPLVQVNLVDLQLDIPTSSQLDIPANLIEPILGAVTFPNDAAVAVTWMNRVQDHFIVSLCSLTACQEIFEYEESNGWVDGTQTLHFNSDASSFVLILPQAYESDSWRQMVQVSRDESNVWMAQQRTPGGGNTVTEILRWDETDNLVWYLATSTSDSADLHLYSVNESGGITCLTCGTMSSTEVQCLYNEASFSLQGTWIAVTCAGPGLPEVYIHEKSGVRRREVELNSQLAEVLNNYSMPIPQRISFPVGEGFDSADATILVPPNFDSSGNTKYPLLVTVYGGPDSSQVTRRWSLDWTSSLVSRYNIIVANIDGRGSGLKGNNNMFSLYKNLGSVEIDDQINITRYFQNNLGYVDETRTCIWGWSYGGYAAALALARGGEVFRCAMAVAPVTDWIYYDTIYTERYMGLPTENDNLAGYQAASVNRQEIAEALANKNFMLVHGTLDDNVHYQQAMMLARVLQQNDVYFTQMSYADEDHSLNGVRPHLYHGLERFLNNSMLR